MDSQTLMMLPEKVVAHTYARYPLLLVRGKGTRVWDLDGKEYLEFLSGLAVCNLGHCHPKVVKAIHARLVADGRRHLVKLVGPNNSGGAAYLSNAVSELNKEIDIYSGHEYNFDYNGWANLCNKMKNTVASTGKPF